MQNIWKANRFPTLLCSYFSDLIFATLDVPKRRQSIVLMLALDKRHCSILCLAEIWLDWLKDEIRMATENSDREKIYNLFERAVKDYLCK